MKKLITICLIMAATFATQAQEKGPSKEETVAYLNKMTTEKIDLKDGTSSRLSFSVEGKMIKIRYIPEFSFMNEDIEINAYSTAEIKDGDAIFYRSIFIYETKSTSDLSRFKKAFDHLLYLVNNDKSDPFGN